LDPPYTLQHAHSHRQHSPTRATTQEFLVFIRHPEPQLKRCHSEPQLKECHVLNPYPKPQLKEPNKPTFKVSPKLCRSRTSKANKAYAFASSPSAALELSCETRFQIACGGHVPRSAKRL